MLEFKNTHLPIKHGFYLKIWNKLNICYLVFDDQKVYNNWLEGLEKHISTLKPVERVDHYGCIYDLAITDLENKLWLDIKLTAVKSDVSSVTEFFLFDISQTNLYSSVKEVLAAIDGHLDKANLEVFREFLLDIVRNVGIKNAAKDIVSEMTAKSFQFSQEVNKIYKQHYRNTDTDTIHMDIAKIMENSQVAYDAFNNTLKVMELQKLVLQTELHEVFSLQHSPRTSRGLVNIERNLDYIMAKRNAIERDKPSNCLGKCDVCNCLVF